VFIAFHFGKVPIAGIGGFGARKRRAEARLGGSHENYDFEELATKGWVKRNVRRRSEPKETSFLPVA
jgi:hypothetical protein